MKIVYKLAVIAVESELTHGNPGGITRHMLQSLHMWCAQQYTLVLIAAGRLEAAKQFLQQVPDDVRGGTETDNTIKKNSSIFSISP